jgi:DNA-binding SARP family transcriptional activator/Tfp pilus assembly protein PilF
MTGELATGLRLTLLGEVGAAGVGDARMERVLAQPKRFALLAYLAAALPRGFHRRDELMALFWPELEHERASGSLRQSLHFLRQSLPPDALLNRGSGEVRIDPRVVACDVVRFESLLDSRREEEALAEYGGELMPAFHLRGASGFDGWLELERERLRRRAARAAAFLAGESARDGKPRDAANWALRAVACAPLDETVQLQAAGLLLELGERSDALQVLAGAMARMVEHGVHAAPAMERLAERIRSGLHSTADATSQRLSPPVPPLPPIVSGTVRAAAPNSDKPAAADPAAYRAWVLGRHCSRQRTPASMLEAVGHYRTALRLDPGFALAHVGLAEAWTVLPVYSAHPPADAYPRAKHHAARALALDEALPDAHAYFALATVCYEWDWPKAGREFQRALELGPGSSDVLVAYALYYLTPLGRFAEAMDVIEAARRSSPTSPAESAYVAMVCYHARAFDRALVEARLSLQLHEPFPLGWWALGLAQEQLGRTADAVAAYERAVALTEESPLMLAQLGRALARAGNVREARAIASRLHGGAELHVPTPYFTASLYAATGDLELAQDSLERAYRERAPHLVFLKVAPEMDELRGETRFRQLLARMGLNGSTPMPG